LAGKIFGILPLPEWKKRPTKGRGKPLNFGNIGGDKRRGRRRNFLNFPGESKGAPGERRRF